MSRRRHTPEQIITALREAEVGLANGKTVAMVSRELGISEQTYYRWSTEVRGKMNGGSELDASVELEKENASAKAGAVKANLTPYGQADPERKRPRETSEPRAPTQVRDACTVSDSGRVNVTRVGRTGSAALDASAG